MSFPFGGFKTPKKSRIGRYSNALRNYRAEMDFDEGDPDNFRENLKLRADYEARVRFEKCWKEKLSKEEGQYEDLSLNFQVIGQSHMDIAWLWRLYQIVNKARITLGKAAFHIENIPNFHFVFSQPLMLDWLSKADPKTFQKVSMAIESGRFELQGGMWVEADGKVPSGESYCRQRLYGQLYYQKHFGKLAEVEWLPDSFGYNNNLPQFSAKSGCKYFHTQKIVGNYFVAGHEFPFAHFKWRSPNGSEVICHSTNTQYRPMTRWSKYGHTRRILRPGTELICDYRTKDPGKSPHLGEIWKEILLLIGVGDGGHGPQSEEVHRALHYIDQGKITNFTSIKNYFEKYQGIKHRLPIWNGCELYYNLHRGTLTTQGLMKRMNRYFEWNLTGLQSLYSLHFFLNHISFDTEVQNQFETLWKDTLLLQFHDILPGSSIPEVYDDCYDIWVENRESLMGLQDKLIKNSTDQFSQNKNQTSEIDEEVITTIQVMNQSDYSGVSPIKLELSEEINTLIKNSGKLVQVRDETGELWPIQKIDPIEFEEPLLQQQSHLLFCAPLKSWGRHHFQLVGVDSYDSIEQELDFKEGDEGYEIESRFQILKISKLTGLLSSYVDKRLNSQNSKIIERSSNKLCGFYDWSFVEPAWNIGRGYLEMPFEDDDMILIGIELKEVGPVRITLEIIYEIQTEYSSRFNYFMHVYRDLPGIYYEVKIDWHHEEAIAKNYFTFTTDSQYAVAEGPYTTEIYTADPKKRTSLDSERWESCGHTWVAFPEHNYDPYVIHTHPEKLLQDNHWGVAYLNDCKYGFDVHNSRLGITLVRGPKYPNATGYPMIERKNQKENKTPTHTDQGEHYIQYAIVPYKGIWSQANIPQLAHQFNSPPLSRLVDNNLAHLSEFKMLSITTDRDLNNLEISCMKLPEVRSKKGVKLILRVVETARIPTKGNIYIPLSWKITEVALVDLLERGVNDSPLEISIENGFVKNIKLQWNPHEIHSLMLQKA